MSFLRSTVPRRTFWKIATGTVRGHVVSAERAGFFFSHNQISYRLAGTVNSGEDIIAASIEETHAAAKQAVVGKVVMIAYEQHVLGAPWKGWIAAPIYVKSFTVCGNTDTSDDK
jgi:hypothetical protein